MGRGTLAHSENAPLLRSAHAETLQPKSSVLVSAEPAIPPDNYTRNFSGYKKIVDNCRGRKVMIVRGNIMALLVHHLQVKMMFTSSFVLGWAIGSPLLAGWTS